MVTTNTLSIWNDLRPFQVGFDNAFERFNTQLKHTQGSNFPPYNIKKLDNFNWTIEMALAGFSKKDIGIEYADNQLTIESVFEKDEKTTNLNEIVAAGIESIYGTQKYAYSNR